MSGISREMMIKKNFSGVRKNNYQAGNCRSRASSRPDFRGLWIIIIAIFSINCIDASFVQVYFEGFESGNLDGWIRTHATGANNWTVSGVDKFMGNYHGQSQPMSTSEPASVLERAISTSGYKDIVINYSRRLVELDIADEYQFKWSIGEGWNVLEQTGSNPANDAGYVSKEFVLPVGAGNSSGFRIRFECTAGAVSEFCRIDNINISGKVIDNSPPVFSGLSESPQNGSSYEQGRNYFFNVSVTDSNLESVWMEWESQNQSMYSITNLSNVYMFNRSGLAAGVYGYNWHAIDRNSNYNRTGTYYYTVSRSSQNAILSFDKTLLSYGEKINASCNGELYRNNINVTLENSKEVVLGAGEYNYSCKLYEGQNLSYSDDNRSVRITKANLSFIFMVNSGYENVSVNYTGLINASAVSDAGTVNIERDGQNIISENHRNVILAAGSYIYRANASGNQNYSDSGYRHFNVTVNKAGTVTNVIVFPIESSEYKTYSNFTCNNSLGITSTLYINSVNRNEEAGMNIIRGAGNYSVNCTFHGNQNYSGSSGIIEYTIYKADPRPWMMINGSENLVYGSLSDFVHSEQNQGDGDCAYFIDKANAIYSGGMHVFNYSTSGCSNYSSGSITKTLVINKSVPILNFLLNQADENLTLQYKNLVNASAYSTGGRLNIVRDNLDVRSENHINVLLGAKTYIYKVNVTGNENYTDIETRWYSVMVLPANPEDGMQISVTPSEEVVYGTQTSAYASESNSADAGCGYVLFRNNVPVSNPNIINLDSGNYTYLYNTSGCQNYSQGIVTKSVRVNKLGNRLELRINDIENSISITYPENISINATSESGNIKIYRNNQDITGENNKKIRLASGMYEYYLNSSGGVNHLDNTTGVRHNVSVLKARPELKLFLNNSMANLTVSDKDEVLVNVSVESREGEYEFYINNELKYRGMLAYGDRVSNPVPGYYELKAVYAETMNYSETTEKIYLRVRDSTGPNITIIQPENKVYWYNESIPFEFIINDHSSLEYCFWNIDDGINNTIDCWANLTIDTADGNHVVNLYAVDVEGNIGGSSRNFLVLTTEFVELAGPINNQWSKEEETVFSYYSFSWGGFDNCSLLVGIWNSSMLNVAMHNQSQINNTNGLNTFWYNLSEGTHEWNVVCSKGQKSYRSEENFTLNVDRIFPVMSVISPKNNDVIGQNVSIIIGLNLSDLNLDSCAYSLDRGKNNISFNCKNGYNNITVGAANRTYNLSLYASDKAMNIRTIVVYNVSINHDKIKPNVTLTEPAGVKTSKEKIKLMFTVNDDSTDRSEIKCSYKLIFKNGGNVPGFENIQLETCTEIEFDVVFESEYVLLLYARDLTGNVENQNISFSVVHNRDDSGSVSSGSGGSGRGFLRSGQQSTVEGNQSMFSLKISELSDIIVRPKDENKMIVSAKNIGEKFLNRCRLIFGGEKPGFFQSNDVAGIAPGESIELGMNIRIPEQTLSGSYRNIITVSCEEYVVGKEVNVIIKNVNDILRFNQISQEEGGIKIQYSYFNKDKKKKMMTIMLWLKKLDDKKIVVVKDSFMLDMEVINREMFLEIPEETTGLHELYLSVFEDQEDFVKQSIVLGKSSITGSAVEGESNIRTFSFLFLFIAVMIIIIIAAEKIIRNRKYAQSENTGSSTKNVQTVKTQEQERESGERFFFD